MKLLMENWRHYLTEEQQLSDEFLEFLFSDRISAFMSDSTLNEVESLETKAKRLAKKYGVPFAIAMGILTGAAGSKVVGDMQSPANDPEIVQQIEKPSPRSSLPPGYSDLTNLQAMEKAWETIDGKQHQAAPVSGGYPTAQGMMPFTYVPAVELSGGDILPMSLMTADEYRAFILDKLESGNPQEVVYLKNMVYGDTAKWLSGTGESDFRVTNGLPVLPPEWSIAHDVFASEVEDRINKVVEYLQENPDHREAVAMELNLASVDDLEPFINSQYAKLAR